jgi:hypothetical protein
MAGQLWAPKIAYLEQHERLLMKEKLFLVSGHRDRLNNLQPPCMRESEAIDEEHEAIGAFARRDLIKIQSTSARCMLGRT